MRLLNYASRDLLDRPRAGLLHDGLVYSLAELLGDKPMPPIGAGNLVDLPIWRERLAGVLFFVHGRTATYTLAWTGPEGRRRHAHNLLLWRAVLALRERGLGWLDLGGVNAAAPGVARFKLGLGGRLHTLAGTFI